MLAQRPKIGPLLRSRPRLLERLPDSPGWTVWLEAPFGYGKSVLAAQWAEGLEAAGWRVLWLSAQDRPVQGALAELLELPGEPTPATIRAALWSVETLLVLEDLGDGADVDELLQDPRGLLLLASRGGLASPALLRCLTAGTALHLTASDLAFTLDEAAQLFGSRGAAETAWNESGGWPLPLHVAALTGRAAAPEPLMVGVRHSLPPELWEELLFQSAVPYLPTGAATPASVGLAGAGFSQEIAAGYRLHELMALSVRRANAWEVGAAVRKHAGRLPLALRAEAFARAGLLAELTDLLEHDEVPGRLGSLDPEGMLRWDELCGGGAGPTRLLSRAWALSVTGRRADAMAALDAVAEHPEATAGHRLIALGWRVFELEPDELPEAEAVLERAAAALAAAEPRAAASFLANASVFFYKRQDWERVGAMQERAIALLEGVEGNDDHRAVLLHRLAEVRWETRGDLLGYVEASERQYRMQAPVNQYNALVAQSVLGTLKALLSDGQAAEHLEAARAGWRHNGLTACMAAAERAALGRDHEAFPAIVERFAPWRRSFPEMDERIRELWARTLRRADAADRALEVLSGCRGIGAAAERALALAELGRTAEARAALPDPASAKSRLTLLEVLAARHLVGAAERSAGRRDAAAVGTDGRAAADRAAGEASAGLDAAPVDTADLDALIAGTNAGARVLPHLLPLAALPRHWPELAAPYALSEVLAAGWQEAIEARLAEVPPLRVDLLGRFEVTLLGRRLTLSPRHKEIVALLALGYDRAAVGLALWPDADKRKVQNNLQVQLTMLRRELEPWGVRTYLSDAGLERTVCDLAALRAALAAGRADEAARLYREPLAAGLDLPVLDEERDQLREDVLAALKAAAGTAVATSDFATAVGLLDHVLRLDPLDEDALAAQVTALVSVGRKREAHKRYRLFAERLHDQLGLAPQRATGAALGL
ncbi:MAG: hypothetical protein M9914_04725 [Trueperaceae bacterium]|nr:hypothetical protein [Trueperaceae bacterium]